MTKLLVLLAVVLAPMLWRETTTAYAEGVGLYPTSLALRDSLRGGVYFSDIGVLNSGARDIVVNVVREGEVAGWVTVHDPEDRETPLAEVHAAPGQTRLVARVAVPATASNGNHPGRLVFQVKVEPDDAGKQSQTSVNVSVEMSLLVSVSGEQQLDGSVIDLSVGDTEVGEPLIVKALFNNTGNVVASPQIRLQVKAADATVIDEKSYADQSVPPRETKELISRWDTAGRVPGRYAAGVAVLLGNRELKVAQVPFQLLPAGSLQRSGSIDRLRLLNAPEAGGVAKVEVLFMNSGQSESTVSFIGEVQRDGLLLEPVQTVGTVVLPGRTHSIEVLIKVPEAGRYLLRGKANFEGRETEPREIQFDVAGSSTETLDDVPGAGLLLPGAGALLIGAVFGGALVMFRGRRTSPGSEIARKGFAPTSQKMRRGWKGVQRRE